MVNRSSFYIGGLLHLGWIYSQQSLFEQFGRKNQGNALLRFALFCFPNSSFSNSLPKTGQQYTLTTYT